jgi:hypothetical protein
MESGKVDILCSDDVYAEVKLRLRIRKLSSGNKIVKYCQCVNQAGKY